MIAYDPVFPYINLQNMFAESKKRELSEEGSENIKGDKNADKTDILRAHEYEELARLCLRRKQY